MITRPYIMLSSAMSLDACIDDARGRGRKLSDQADWDVVDKLRAASDAILVGAETLRRNNPSLIVHSAESRQARVKSGRPPNPTRISLTLSGNLSPKLRFFDKESGNCLLFCPQAIEAILRHNLGQGILLLPFPDSGLTASFLSSALLDRGIARLMVEGGSKTLSWFVQNSLFDEWRLAIAPQLLSSQGAPRIIAGLANDTHLRLSRLEQVGSMAVLWLRPG